MKMTTIERLEHWKSIHSSRWCSLSCPVGDWEVNLYGEFTDVEIDGQSLDYTLNAAIDLWEREEEL